MSAPVVAVAARRRRFEHDGLGAWWYVMTLKGTRGATYEVELAHYDGFERPAPFRTTRLGRSARRVGGDLRRALDRAAIEAVR